MKIQVLSDIHLECADFKAPPTNTDVVILAGDISMGGDLGVLWAKLTFDKPVLYVAGNHEFHETDTPMQQLDSHLKAAAQNSNVIVLDNESVVLDDVRFIGSTLWTDMREADEVLYPDGAYIQVQGRDEFDKPFAQQLFQQNLTWLTQELAKPFQGQTVVITHHAPSPQSIHPQFEDHPFNTCYISDLEHLMGEHIALWIHGHTHNSLDYVMNQTRVVCNPRGYPHALGGWKNRAFNPELVLDLGRSTT